MRPGFLHKSKDFTDCIGTEQPTQNTRAAQVGQGRISVAALGHGLRLLGVYVGYSSRRFTCDLHVTYADG